MALYGSVSGEIAAAEANIAACEFEKCIERLIEGEQGAMLQCRERVTVYTINGDEKLELCDVCSACGRTIS